MTRKQFKTIEEYINAQPENSRIKLMELKACVLEAVPEAIEKVYCIAHIRKNYT